MGKETPLDLALAVPWRAERELQVSESRVRKQQRRNKRASEVGRDTISTESLRKYGGETRGEIRPVHRGKRAALEPLLQQLGWSVTDVSSRNRGDGGLLVLFQLAPCS